MYPNFERNPHPESDFESSRFPGVLVLVKVIAFRMCSSRGRAVVPDKEQDRVRKRRLKSDEPSFELPSVYEKLERQEFAV